MLSSRPETWTGLFLINIRDKMMRLVMPLNESIKHGLLPLFYFFLSLLVSCIMISLLFNSL